MDVLIDPRQSRSELKKKAFFALKDSFQGRKDKFKKYGLCDLPF